MSKIMSKISPKESLRVNDILTKILIIKPILIVQKCDRIFLQCKKFVLSLWEIKKIEFL